MSLIGRTGYCCAWASGANAVNDEAAMIWRRLSMIVVSSFWMGWNSGNALAVFSVSQVGS